MDLFSFQCNIDSHRRRRHRTRISNTSSDFFSAVDNFPGCADTEIHISAYLDMKLTDSLDFITGVERDAGLGSAQTSEVRHAILSTLRPNDIVDNASTLHEYWHEAATNPHVWEPAYRVSRCSALRGNKGIPRPTPSLRPISTIGCVNSGGLGAAASTPLAENDAVPINDDAGAIASAAASSNIWYRGGNSSAECDAVRGDNDGFDEDPPAAGLCFPTPMMYKVVLESCEIHWRALEDLTFFSIPSSPLIPVNEGVQDIKSLDSTQNPKVTKKSAGAATSSSFVDSSFFSLFKSSPATSSASTLAATAFTRGIHGIFTQRHSPFWLRALAILHVLCRNGKFLESSLGGHHSAFGPHVLFEKMHRLFLLYAQVLTSHQVSPQPTGTLWLLSLYEWAATQNTAASTTMKDSLLTRLFNQQIRHPHAVGQDSSNKGRGRTLRKSSREHSPSKRSSRLTSISTSELLSNSTSFFGDPLKDSIYMNSSKCLSEYVRRNTGAKDNRNKLEWRANYDKSSDTICNKTILPFHKMMIAPAAIILRSDLIAPLAPHILYSIIRLTTQMIGRYVRGDAYLLQPSSLVLGDPTPLHAADPRACYGIYIQLLMKYPEYRKCVEEVVLQHFGDVGMWELEMARSRVGGLVVAHDLKKQPQVNEMEFGCGTINKGNTAPVPVPQCSTKDTDESDVRNAYIKSPLSGLASLYSKVMDEKASDGTPAIPVMNFRIEAERVPYDDEIDRVFIPNR